MDPIKQNSTSQVFLSAFTLYKNGNYRQAESLCRQILTIRPEHADANNLLGIIELKKGRKGQAVKLISKAIQQEHNVAFFHNSLGIALKEQGLLDAAAAAFSRALLINPGYAAAYNNLGNVRKDTGRQEEALTSYRAALGLNPNFVEAHSNLLYCLLAIPDITSREIYEEAARWNLQHALPLHEKKQRYYVSRKQNRRLRIGYVSPDFRCHAVNVFFEPLLRAHDRDHFEIYLYSNVSTPDQVTLQLQAKADHWLSIVGMSDADAAARIRLDKIDILVDLAKHTANNRLLIFAYKPAPIQVSWLGYPATTGLQTIDFRIVDAWTHPDHTESEFSSEELIRLPHGYFCFTPLENSPSVAESPFLKTDRITFGSVNNLMKINTEVINLWSDILKKVPKAHLLIVAKPLAEQSVQNRFREEFLRKGIDKERLEFLPAMPYEEFLAFLNRIDIALDPFPYNGHTTTCDTLWMGIPVISLKGELQCSRVGPSILSRIGLDELIAGNRGEYVDKAVRLAEDRQRLKLLRAEMRDRVRGSSLCDVDTFTRSMEDAYLKMWDRYVRNLNPAHTE